MLRIRLTRSRIGKPEKLKRVLEGLGLRRVGQTVTKPDNPSTRGMIRKVSHLVEVEEVKGD